MLASAYHIDGDDPMSKYQVVERIGHGSFGEVLKAAHKPTGRVVALKKVLLRRPDKGLPDNLLREVKLLQQVEHPNVVGLYEVFAQGASLVLSFQYCPTDLAQLLKSSAHQLEEHVVKGVMQQLVRGVAAMHRAKVLHRDLKPSNVLVSEEGVVKLADFGLARLHDNRLPYTHTVATRWYRAPELLYGARVYGTGVDMWAVGCIFAELLGKCPLLPGEHDIDQLYCVIKLLGNPQEARWPQLAALPDYPKISFPQMPGTPLSEVLPDAPCSALALLTRLLEWNPDDRPSAEEVLQDPYFFENPLPALPGDMPRANQLKATTGIVQWDPDVLELPASG